MPVPFDHHKTYMPFKNKYLRVLSSIIGQKSATMMCPETRSLDGKLALVTGGNRGIGLEITKGLVRRGADVIVAARGSDADKSQQTEDKNDGEVSFLTLDLADKDSIEDAVLELSWQNPNRKIDIFCANAGISETQSSQNNEGLELCFAVNCLGHQRLFNALLQRDCLSTGARVIFTTGDIYVLADNCSAEFTFRGRSISAYSRSKLGNLWQQQEISYHFPDLKCIAVHPGVVATELEGSIKGLAGFFKRRLMISPFLGAQASLIAATQDIPTGSYFHNMRGIVELSGTDAGHNQQKREVFWNLLNAIPK
ncbi:MAG: SDR family NAD(P)-dependent oxidoreductase [Parasphingorhabdus sp.]|uniref:SDR family NAD(P)-dependent oxidoreductase n=1 Tax=Parasphingorhabdus sp. TaxID=2709688 RepID=UPI00329892FA